MNMRKTMDMYRTCQNIRSLCEYKGYSAGSIAEELNISKQTVYCWFSAKKFPSIDHIVELSDILGVPIDEMIVRKEYMCA
ncbi:MAG: helix-turn-helix domain-containing protein [Lachnospiraceae bacterium]|nr:helix-turn-helix domain-containing protein [Lachnospiraceae bacterium]